jgi:hypothetical protein
LHCQEIGKEGQIMFGRPDHTYNDIREKSLMQWLDEMEQHPDIAVHGGVKLAREYVDHLKTEIARLESENALKAEYLKKMKEKK